MARRGLTEREKRRAGLVDSLLLAWERDAAAGLRQDGDA